MMIAILLLFQMLHATEITSLIDDPYNPYLLYNHANAHAKNNNHEQAINYFERAQQSGSLSAEELFQVLYNKGNSFALAKRYQEALDVFSELLLQKPDDIRITQKVEYLKQQLNEQEKDNSQSDGDSESNEQSQKDESHDQKDDTLKDEEKRDSEQGENRNQKEDADTKKPQQRQEKNNKAQSQKTEEESQDKRDQELEKYDTDNKTQKKGKQDHEQPAQTLSTAENSTTKNKPSPEDQLIETLLSIDKQYAREFVKHEIQAHDGRSNQW